MASAVRLTALFAVAAALVGLAGPARAGFNHDLVPQAITFNSPFGAVSRSALSESQKRELRAYGREMCRKKLKYDTSARIRSVTILSDGRVRCYYAS